MNERQKDFQTILNKFNQNEFNDKGMTMKLGLMMSWIQLDLNYMFDNGNNGNNFGNNGNNWNNGNNFGNNGNNFAKFNPTGF